MPSDEPGPFVREVHAPETGLPGPQERLADRVVMGPHEIIIDSDVLKLHGVPVGPEDLSVAPRGDHQLRVHGALGSIQRVHEGTLLGRAELHHVSSYCGITAAKERGLTLSVIIYLGIVFF